MCLVLFTCICAGAPAVAADEWLFGQTDDFDIASNASSKRTQYLVRELELVRTVFHSLNPGYLDLPSSRLQVIICKGSGTMDRMMPLYQGKPKQLGGLFSSDEQGWFICINGRGSLKYSRRIAYHEYVHYLMDLQDQKLPAWMSEGVAELFSTVEIGSGKQVMVGRAPLGNLARLRKSPMIPLERLFAVSYDSPEYNSERHGQGQFYAQSWALVHYLLFGDDGLP